MPPNYFLIGMRLVYTYIFKSASTINKKKRAIITLFFGKHNDYVQVAAVFVAGVAAATAFPDVKLLTLLATGSQ